MKKIAIIGGGPAGLMSASTILETAQNRDFHIHLFEGNKTLGKKLLISGGGRCNITTAISDKKILATKYVRGWNFFKSSLGNFGPKKCQKWFENHNLQLKTKPDNRVFPLSDNGQDVLDCFLKIFEKYSENITLHLGEKTQNIRQNHDETFIIQTEKNHYNADYAIIATGGNAYAHTGSQGDGYTFAKNLGHSVTQLGPSLSSFLVQEDFIKNLSGLSFENAGLFFENSEGKQILSGPILCTHFGISGPLTFMMSSHLAWENIENKKIFFSPKSGISAHKWDEILQQAFQKSPKKILHSTLRQFLPSRFVSQFIETFFKNIAETFVGQINAKNRKEIAKLLGNGISLTLLARRPGDEFVTAGGISTDEISSKTLESKITKKCFFAGEILNIDGYTGGFSLQVCWSTGYQAGYSLSQFL